MSIRVMTLIWDTCLYQGGTLNVLLAMADHASDNGRDVYPGMEYLAAKCRQTVRATQDCVKRLRADRVAILLDRNGNDLEPSENPTGGRGYRAEYRIDLERVKELQGLHQAEHPDCELCKAGNKTPQRDGKKGEVGDRKGEKSRSHIDRTVKEPSRTSLAPAGAGESEKIASRGEGEVQRWPEFRTAVAKTWPDAFPADDEVACRKQFARLTRVHAADLLIACARLHGNELRQRKEKRGKRGGITFAKRPSNWLQQGDWEGYIPQAEQMAADEAGIATALGNVQRAMGEGVFKLLRERMDDAALARLDGMTFSPPAGFTVKSAFQKSLLDRHTSALERHLGDRATFTLVQPVRRVS
jgi:hypothetical protein